MIKRILCIILTLFLCVSLFSCDIQKIECGKIKILCTLFPQYDWLRNITKGSEYVDVSLLITNGADPHSYQPTAQDIMNISTCDAIVFVGGDSDTWVQKAIERSKNQTLKSIALTKLDGITLQNISASSHSHAEGEHAHEHEGHSHGTVDEHLYLSLHNAITATEALCDVICEIDPDGKELYETNTKEYIDKLSTLDSSFKEDLKQSTNEDAFMLFADRFPFVYLLSDYGISYAAAFEGCSTDASASFDTVIRLIKEADEHNAKYIAVTETSNKALANTVISSTKTKDQKIITLNSMQSVTKKQIENGMTYLSIMESNLDLVRTAIGIKK